MAKTTNEEKEKLKRCTIFLEEDQVGTIDEIAKEFPKNLKQKNAFDFYFSGQTQDLSQSLPLKVSIRGQALDKLSPLPLTKRSFVFC
ncbi:MAG: hypothetical protein HZB80_04440, partial [Deltaproteobacteria bacterium]|nr:hypothetical protein [Deltaproteobacteria bacterium]